MLRFEAFAKYLTLGGGIYGLPGARTLEGNFPFWDSVGVRQQADEFFRPAYTSGIFGRGTIRKGLTYQAMIGNNLSTLGVSAGQLPNTFNTVSTAVMWMPTTGEYGAGYGDFENHESVATRFGGHFTNNSITYTVGNTGPIFNTIFEVAFQEAMSDRMPPERTRRYEIQRPAIASRVR